MMLSDNTKIMDIMYDNVLGIHARLNNISLLESKEAMSNMSFSQYLKLVEAGANIPSPSGQTIGPTGSTGTTGTPASQSNASNIKSIWPGKGAPVQQGMTVGLQGQTGQPVPGEVTRIDQATKGVIVRNPTTGQEETHSMDDLQPFMANKSTTQVQPQQNTQMSENKDIVRMKHLAGIVETCSSGSTGAGAIAVSPASMSNIKKRQPVEESPPKEHIRTDSYKSIIGDTKPNQASGELSANLAARNKKTATRTNNGFKK